jgi:hypothetical protein
MAIILALSACGSRSSDEKSEVPTGFFAAEDFTTSDIPLVAVLTNNGTINTYEVRRAKFRDSALLTFKKAGSVGTLNTNILPGTSDVSDVGGRESTRLSSRYTIRNKKLIGQHSKRSHADESEKTFETQYYATEKEEFLKSFRAIIAPLRAQIIGGAAKIDKGQEAFCQELFGLDCALVVL